MKNTSAKFLLEMQRSCTVAIAKSDLYRRRDFYEKKLMCSAIDGLIKTVKPIVRSKQIIDMVIRSH